MTETEQKEQAIFSLFKRLGMMGLWVGSVSGIWATFQSSEPVEIMATMFLFLVFLGIALPITVVAEAVTQKKTWHDLLKADTTEGFVFFIGASVFGAAAACVTFSIPAFSFPYFVHQLEPNQMSTTFFDTFNLKSFGIIVGITGFIACGLAVALYRRLWRA
jgi:hypothetical protein